MSKRKMPSLHGFTIHELETLEDAGLRATDDCIKITKATFLELISMARSHAILQELKSSQPPTPPTQP